MAATSAAPETSATIYAASNGTGDLGGTKNPQAGRGFDSLASHNEENLGNNKFNFKNKTMKRQKILFMIALLCAIVQGAWADDGWSSASSYDKYSDADKPTHYDTYGGRSDVHVIKTAANYLYVMDIEDLDKS